MQQHYNSLPHLARKSTTSQVQNLFLGVDCMLLKAERSMWHCMM